jgi:hypothetical protein
MGKGPEDRSWATGLRDGGMGEWQWEWETGMAEKERGGGREEARRRMGSFGMGCRWLDGGWDAVK